MEVETVSTRDQSLLGAVRRTLAFGDEALLCVAFVHARGVHLLERELRLLSARARLVATTTFDRTEGTALGVAAGLGTQVRTFNPGSGSTYHPKVFLGRKGRKLSAVVGSANLTGGLATNIEVGVALKGSLDDRPLAELYEWAERIWSQDSSLWRPMLADAPPDDELLPELLSALSPELWRGRVVMTLGNRPAPNTVVEVTPSEVLVETNRSRASTGQPTSIPAWMFNIAWEYLRSRGELSNATLLNDLRVMRSSAVCAILASIPGVDRVPGRVAIRLAPAPR